MDFRSTKARCSVVVGILFLLTLVALRIYGLFVNERQQALLRAGRATEESRSLESEAQQIGQVADSTRRVAKVEARAAASPDEKVRLLVEVETANDGYLSRQLTALTKGLEQETYAFAEREYAAHRWLIARHILYRIWLAITGETESDAEHVRFLSPNAKALEAKSMLDQKLLAAQACDSRTVACKGDCKTATSFVQALACTEACGGCTAEAAR